MKKKVKILYHNQEYKLKQFGDWIDLAVAQNYYIFNGESKLLDLGVSIKLPKYYEVLLVPRSSTYKKYGLIQTNHVGVIDNAYCGNGDIWMMPVLRIASNHMDSQVITINKNTRVAQFRIQLKMNVPWWVKIIDLFTRFKFTEVKDLESEDRGGFGSTGE